MSVLDKCFLCETRSDTLLLCRGCLMVSYCCKEHQIGDWPLHKLRCKMIPGTREVKKSAPLGPNPLHPDLKYPPRRDGSTMNQPLLVDLLFKHRRNGTRKVRLIRLGKLAAYNPISDAIVPEEPEHCKLVPLPNGKYRHIATFSLKELRQIGWDGSMYLADDAHHAARGFWVPYVSGYDSDPDMDFEPFDMQEMRRKGTVGVREDEVGKFVYVPDRGIMELLIPKEELAAQAASAGAMARSS